MTEIKFKNGNYIKVISSNENYRSKRAEEQWGYSKEQLEYWKRNPDKFLEQFYAIELLPYQKLLLKCSKNGGKHIMKIIETGTTYKIYGEDLIVLDNLPVQTYKVGFSKLTGFFLEKQHDLEIKEDKVYGVHEEKANKVLRRFEKSRKNLGVILSGDKGIGKSLFARLLSQKALQNNIPVILVDNFVPGIDDFLNSIKNEVLVLFDEFDKTFAKNDNGDPQSMLLSLFDGTSSGKKLFVITCNNYKSLNEYLINRPGKFHFHFRFEYPTVEEVKTYLHDKLDEKYFSEINKVAIFSRKVKLNYDCLSAIALELNEGETFETAIKDLNIVNVSSNNMYKVTLLTEEGLVFNSYRADIDFFDDDKQSVYVIDQYRNGIYMVFDTNDVSFEDGSSVAMLAGDKIKIDIDEYYINDNSNVETYKNLHCRYAEISQNNYDSLHYNF